MYSADPLRRSFLILLVVFLGLGAFIGTIGYRTYKDQKARLEADVRSELTVVADLKVGQVVQWRDERLADARMAAAATVLPAIQRVLEGRVDSRDQAAAWLTAIQDGTRYADAILTSSDGKVRLSGGKVDSANPIFAEHMKELREKGQVVFSDIAFDPGFGGPLMRLIIPLRRDGILRGAMLLGIDPSRFLYPLLRTWPEPSVSAETLLVRKEGNEVVFLNELRHRANTSLRLRIPLTQTSVLAVQAVNGREGLADGVDYRGVRVLGVLRRIPNSPWWLVAKIDADEVYAPLRQQAVWLGLLGSSLLLTAGTCGGFVWRHLRASLDRQRFAESQRAEESLRRSEERFRSVVENAPEGIIIHNNAIIRYANPAALSILGAKEPGQLLGRSLMDRIHPDFHQAVQLRIRGSQLAWEPVPAMEQAWITEDGQSVDVEVSSVPFIHNQEDAALVFFHDVTERKRAEEARRRTQSLLQSVIEGTSDAVYVKDAEGRYLLVNSSVGRAMGKPVQDIIGRDDLALWPPGMGEAIMAADQTVMRERRTTTVEESMRLNNGAIATYFTAKGPMIDHRGNVVGLFGISRDVTERNRAEQERARLQEQLQQAQKMESIGRLAGGVAHDFNNLLTVINGYSGMLLSEVGPNDPIRPRLEEIATAGERAAELTRQLLAFSRKQVIEPRILDLNQVVEDVTKMLRRLLGEDIAVHTVLAPDLGPIRSDSGQLHQLLMNLAVNARDAMPNGGKFVIETENIEIDEEYAATHAESRVGAFVLLTVTDTGIGMNEETLRRAFEPFFTTKGTGEGTGLGLSTVYGIVKQGEGWISVYSEVGKGTTFRIYLPRAGNSPTPQHDETAAPKLEGKETILVVEDQDDVRKLTCTVLQRLGYHVLQAPHGSDALRLSKAYEGEIHLLLTDVVMPEMTGRELAERLARERPDIRVVYMSGYTGNVIAKQEVLERGAAYLAKPFSPRALGAKLREVLGG